MKNLGMKKFNWVIFENHLDLLLRDFAKGTQIHHSHNFFYQKAFCPINKTSII